TANRKSVTRNPFDRNNSSIYATKLQKRFNKCNNIAFDIYICNMIAKTMINYLIIPFTFFCTLSFGQEYRGLVVDNSPLQAPIPFATIYFVDLGTTIQTDSLGKWTISDIPAGENRVEIHASGFDPTQRDIHLTPETEITIIIERAHRELDKVIVS